MINIEIRRSVALDSTLPGARADVTESSPDLDMTADAVPAYLADLWGLSGFEERPTIGQESARWLCRDEGGNATTVTVREAAR